MDREPRKPDEPMLSWRLMSRLAAVGLIMGTGTLAVITGAEQARAEAVACTMGVVTFSLYALFFSIATKDERRTVFSLETVADKTFNICTGVSIVTLILATVLGPFEALLKTTSLDVQQWLVCIAVALSVVVMSEIQKITVRRHAGVAPASDAGGPQPPERGSRRKAPGADQGTWAVPPQPGRGRGNWETGDSARRSPPAGSRP